MVVMASGWRTRGVYRDRRAGGFRGVRIAGGGDDYVGRRGDRRSRVKTAGIDRACRRRPRHCRIGGSADRGGELMILIRGQGYARRRQRDLDLRAPFPDAHVERLAPLIAERGVGHHHLERVRARRCRRTRERPRGWVQTDARRESAGTHREMVGGTSATH